MSHAYTQSHIKGSFDTGVYHHSSTAKSLTYSKLFDVTLPLFLYNSSCTTAVVPIEWRTQYRLYDGRSTHDTATATQPSFIPKR